MNKIKLIKELLDNGKITKEEALILLTSSKVNYALAFVGLGLLLIGQAFKKSALVINDWQLTDTNLVQITGMIILVYPIGIKIWHEFKNKKDVRNHEDDTQTNIPTIPKS